MHHFEIVRKVRGQKLFDQTRRAGPDLTPCRVADDVAGFFRRGLGLSEEKRHRNAQRPRDMPKVRDRRLRQIPLHLAEPPHRPPEIAGQSFQRQSPRAPEGTQVRAESTGGGAGVLHRHSPGCVNFLR